MMIAVSPSPFLAEVNRLAAAMGASQPTTARLRLIDQTIRDLIDAGVWAKLDLLYVLGAETSVAALLNWKNPGTNTLTAANSPTFTIDRGYTGNSASSAHLDSGVAMTALTHYQLNDAHVSFWQLNDIAESTFNTGDTLATGTSRTNARSAGNNYVTRLNDVTSHSFANADARGFYTISRSGSSGYSKYKDGASVATPVATSTAVPTGNFSILRSNAVYANAQMFFASVGAALTAGEVSDLYDILNAYKTAVGA